MMITVSIANLVSIIFVIERMTSNIYFVVLLLTGIKIDWYCLR